jgi:hypothetical protein
MKWEDVPESWKDRCSGDGNKRYLDKDGIRRYENDNVPVGEEYRPCAKCGHYPINDGEDYCFHHLGKVINACCGHGTQRGYIQFDNGITIRGYFEIENSNKEVSHE